MMNQSVRDARSMIVRSLLIAGIFLAATIALNVLSPEPIGRDVKQRLIGVMFGLLVVSYANAAPKTLTPLARLRCAPATEQAIRRFAGWVLVLGGLGYVGAWVFAPIERAGVIAIAVLAAAFVTVIARVAWAKASRHRA